MVRRGWIVTKALSFKKSCENILDFWKFLSDRLYVASSVLSFKLQCFQRAGGRRRTRKVEPTITQQTAKRRGRARWKPRRDHGSHAHCAEGGRTEHWDLEIRMQTRLCSARRIYRWRRMLCRQRGEEAILLPAAAAAHGPEPAMAGPDTCAAEPAGLDLSL